MDLEQGYAGATSEPVSIINLVLHSPGEEWTFGEGAKWAFGGGGGGVSAKAASSAPAVVATSASSSLVYGEELRERRRLGDPDLDRRRRCDVLGAPRDGCAPATYAGSRFGRTRIWP